MPSTLLPKAIAGPGCRGHGQAITLFASCPVLANACLRCRSKSSLLCESAHSWSRGGRPSRAEKDSRQRIDPVQTSSEPSGFYFTLAKRRAGTLLAPGLPPVEIRDDLPDSQATTFSGSIAGSRFLRVAVQITALSRSALRGRRDVREAHNPPVHPLASSPPTQCREAASAESGNWRN